jgi:hypothetical protein
MLKKLTLLAALLPTVANAQLIYDYGTQSNDVTVQPRYIDMNPGDGIMDVGTPMNPYVMKDNSGKVVGQVRSKYVDAYPGDGMMDAGSFNNPYVIKRY